VNILQELDKIGLTEEQYQNCLNDISDKLNGLIDMDWEDIKDKYNLPWAKDVIRKSSGTLFGGFAVYEYMKNRGEKPSSLDDKLDQIRRERMKLQTLNVERNRIDRSEIRQELFYENVGSVISTLPLPDFQPIPATKNSIEYCVQLSDLHYGADFKSMNNEYSKEIFQQRLEYLTGWLENFIFEKEISKLHIVSLGDSIQGILRISDLRLNDSNIVKGVVEVSRLIAQFINSLSKYTQVEYYHVPSANHSQLRPLGTKASELPGEDFEYIISNYIKDLVANNNRVCVHLAEEGTEYIEVPIFDFNIIAMHGHQIKNIETSIRDLSVLTRKQLSYLLLGHYHSGKEIPSYEGQYHDCEILIASSFIGSDPYSDRLLKGCKASVKIYGFDEVYGHTESYKCILN
jgi:hypothetical protein